MNTMSIAYLAGGLVGILIGLVLVAILIRYVRTDKKIKAKYDERQELIRGRGFKYAFYTSLVYFGLLTITMLGLTEIVPIPSGVLTFFGVCLSVLVYAGYCIWHEAYFALNENPKRVMIAFSVIGVCNVIIGLSNLHKVTSLQSADATPGLINLTCAVLFVGIFLILLVKHIANRRCKE